MREVSPEQHLQGWSAHSNRISDFIEQSKYSICIFLEQIVLTLYRAKCDVAFSQTPDQIGHFLLNSGAWFSGFPKPPLVVVVVQIENVFYSLTYMSK